MLRQKRLSSIAFFKVCCIADIEEHEQIIFRAYVLYVELLI